MLCMVSSHARVQFRAFYVHYRHHHHHNHQKQDSGRKLERSERNVCTRYFSILLFPLIRVYSFTYEPENITNEGCLGYTETVMYTATPLLSIAHGPVSQERISLIRVYCLYPSVSNENKSRSSPRYKYTRIPSRL